MRPQRHSVAEFYREFQPIRELTGPGSVYIDEWGPATSLPEWMKQWKGDGIIARVRSQQMSERLPLAGAPIVDTLHQILAEERLRRAKQLLIDTDFTLEQIAAMAGFSSAAYLSVVIREHENCTPTEFRHQAFQPGT